MQLQTERLEPCIVLGLETQIGLGLVRELGRAGVPVIGIAHQSNAIGLSSRYITRGIVVPQSRSAELIETIRALGEEFGPCSLLTVSEANLTWLAAHRDAFGKVRPVVPDEAKLSIVLDKQRTLSAARQVGLSVPESVEPVSMQHAHELARDFRFPAVLKWKDPNAVAASLTKHGLELIKAEYVYSAAEFIVAAQRYEPMACWPIVQTYCPGLGLGQFFYVHRGEAIRRFQHVRIAEWPPEGGFSAVCDSVSLEDHASLQERSIALLKHIGWEGVAMVEYRWDPITDQALLMEINGRYWGSYPLAVHCHANFALIAYCIARGMQVPALKPPLSGIRCRLMSIELKRLRRIVLQPRLISDRSFKVAPWSEVTRFIADFFKPGVRYYLWDPDDPKPLFADLWNLIRKIIGPR